MSYMQWRSNVTGYMETITYRQWLGLKRRWEAGEHTVAIEDVA